MGNLQCPAEDAAHLADIARDICPFPDYNPSPHFFHMVSFNSSLHLKNHYTAVQSSLTPQQLDDFTKSLRTTFGREGKVTLGGVGVVALSLAVLFDTIARQVKGERVSESELIPGLFVKDLRGYYPPQVYTISSYLRLVPHIANNPSRMTEETERYVKQLLIDEQTLSADRKYQTQEDVMQINAFLVQLFETHLRVHLSRLTNSTNIDEIVKSVKAQRKSKEHPISSGNTTEPEVDEAHISKSRKRRLPPPENSVIFNLNCDPEAASKTFLAEIEKSDNRTQQAFKACQSNRRVPKTWLHVVARLVWFDAINNPVLYEIEGKQDALIALREDFDLRTNVLY